MKCTSLKNISKIRKTELSRCHADSFSQKLAWFNRSTDSLNDCSRALTSGRNSICGSTFSSKNNTLRSKSFSRHSIPCHDEANSDSETTYNFSDSGRSVTKDTDICKSVDRSSSSLSKLPPKSSVNVKTLARMFESDKKVIGTDQEITSTAYLSCEKKPHTDQDGGSLTKYPSFKTSNSCSGASGDHTQKPGSHCTENILPSPGLPELKIHKDTSSSSDSDQRGDPAKKESMDSSSSFVASVIWKRFEWNKDVRDTIDSGYEPTDTENYSSDIPKENLPEKLGKVDFCTGNKIETLPTILIENAVVQPNKDVSEMKLDILGVDEMRQGVEEVSFATIDRITPHSDKSQRLSARSPLIMGHLADLTEYSLIDSRKSPKSMEKGTEGDKDLDNLELDLCLSVPVDNVWSFDEAEQLQPLITSESPSDLEIVFSCSGEEETEEIIYEKKGNADRFYKLLAEDEDDTSLQCSTFSSSDGEESVGLQKDDNLGLQKDDTPGLQTDGSPLPDGELFVSSGEIDAEIAPVEEINGKSGLELQNSKIQQIDENSLHPYAKFTSKIPFGRIACNTSSFSQDSIGEAELGYDTFSEFNKSADNENNRSAYSRDDVVNTLSVVEAISIRNNKVSETCEDNILLGLDNNNRDAQLNERNSDALHYQNSYYRVETVKLRSPSSPDDDELTSDAKSVRRKSVSFAEDVSVCYTSPNSDTDSSSLIDDPDEYEDVNGWEIPADTSLVGVLGSVPADDGGKLTMDKNKSIEVTMTNDDMTLSSVSSESTLSRYPTKRPSCPSPSSTTSASKYNNSPLEEIEHEIVYNERERPSAESTLFHCNLVSTKMLTTEDQIVEAQDGQELEETVKLREHDEGYDESSGRRQSIVSFSEDVKVCYTSPSLTGSESESNQDAHDIMVSQVTTSGENTAKECAMGFSKSSGVLDESEYEDNSSGHTNQEVQISELTKSSSATGASSHQTRYYSETFVEITSTTSKKASHKFVGAYNEKVHISSCSGKGDEAIKAENEAMEGDYENIPCNYIRKKVIHDVFETENVVETSKPMYEDSGSETSSSDLTSTVSESDSVIEKVADKSGMNLNNSYLNNSMSACISGTITDDEKTKVPLMGRDRLSSMFRNSLIMSRTQHMNDDGLDEGLVSVTGDGISSVQQSSTTELSSLMLTETINSSSGDDKINTSVRVIKPRPYTPTITRFSQRYDTHLNRSIPKFSIEKLAGLGTASGYKRVAFDTNDVPCSSNVCRKTWKKGSLREMLKRIKPRGAGYKYTPTKFDMNVQSHPRTSNPHISNSYFEDDTSGSEGGKPAKQTPVQTISRVGGFFIDEDKNADRAVAPVPETQAVIGSQRLVFKKSDPSAPDPFCFTEGDESSNEKRFRSSFKKMWKK